MERKYWVPALDKAHRVLSEITKNPSSLKLIDLSKQLDINKSSMFSLLQTMEELEWVSRNPDSTYMLGPALGLMGNAYLQQYNLIDLFHKEAMITKNKIEESLQLAKLDQRDVLYLAKEEVPSPVRLTTEPGSKLPANTTALGKVLLAFAGDEAFDSLFTEEQLPSATPNTLNKKQLKEQLKQIRADGYALDLQEAIIGFSCIAAPIFSAKGEAIAAVSCSMPEYKWTEKKDQVIQAVVELGGKLSLTQK